MRALSVCKYGCVAWLIFFCVASTQGQLVQKLDIPFTQYGNLLNTPMSGGFTAPQFSDIDANLDGLNDLYVFDRGAWLSMVFLRDADDNNLYYSDEYSAKFPHLEDWALLRDFNGDAIPDIFTYSLGSTAVYMGKITDGALQFDLEKAELTYSEGASIIALYTSRTDIPSIDDIDGDGDLDVLSFSVSNATIRYYQNQSVEDGYGLDSLNFELVEYCWGELFEEASCDGATMFVSCKGADESPRSFREELHIGSTIVTFDRDGDGDKDAIIGDNLCNNLVYFKNGGDADYAQMNYRDSEFPATSVSFNLPLFPATFLSDVDSDGDEDVIATTNEHQIGANMQQVWWYENLNTNDTFDLVFATDTFLVSEHVDAGMYSKPVFFDYNVDGLLDILIGVGSTYGKDAIQKHGLWLYKNIGTATAPAFELVSTDYAGMNGWPVTQLSPAPGDPDNDGDMDLVIGFNDGTLAFLENTAGAGVEADFASPVFNWMGIDVGQLANPCFIDIEEDGKPDLVIGEQNGNLNYWHNTGTADEPMYTFESDVWGGVDVRKTGFIFGYSAPFMYRNENDSLYAQVGSYSGYVYTFNEIEDALLGEFFEADTNFLNYYPGTYSTIWGGDINNDGEMDWLVGNIRGGVQIFSRQYAIDISEQTNNLDFNIYPNPAQHTFQLQLPAGLADASVRIYTVTGQLVKAVVIPDNATLHQISLSLSPGVYLVSVHASGAGGTETLIIE